METVGYLLMTNVPPSTWLGTIVPQPQIVGRSPDNGIVIPGTYLYVSRRHIQVRTNRESILIQDLNSKGGTLVNGVLLSSKRETEVVFGDRLTLGGLEIIVVSPESELLIQLGDADCETPVETESSVLLSALGNGNSCEARLLRNLTPAELQVVCWMSRGQTTFEEIGARLFRSPHTVRTQLNSIYRKLHVHSREELLAWLTQNEFSWATPPKYDDRESIHDDDWSPGGPDPTA